MSLAVWLSCRFINKGGAVTSRLLAIAWRLFQAGYLIACFVIVARAVWHSRF